MAKDDSRLGSGAAFVHVHYICFISAQNLTALYSAERLTIGTADTACSDLHDDVVRM